MRGLLTGLGALLAGACAEGDGLEGRYTFEAYALREGSCGEPEPAEPPSTAFEVRLANLGDSVRLDVTLCSAGSCDLMPRFVGRLTTLNDRAGSGEEAAATWLGLGTGDGTCNLNWVATDLSRAPDSLKLRFEAWSMVDASVEIEEACPAALEAYPPEARPCDGIWEIEGRPEE